MNGPLTPERLDRLRTWARRYDPDHPEWSDVVDHHVYNGACPWCRADERPRTETRDGNAHDLALELLDEIDRLRSAITAPVLPCPAHLEAKLREVWDRHRLSPLGDEPAPDSVRAELVGGLDPEFMGAFLAEDPASTDRG